MQPALKLLPRIALAVLAFQTPGMASAQGAAACQGEGRLNHIGGLNNAEDMMVVEGSPWVLTGNMGNKNWANGGFYLVDTRDRSVRAVKPDLSRPKAAIYQDCPGAPDAELLNVHGISVRNEGNGKHTVVATVFSNAEDPKSIERAHEGQPSGFVLEWSPASTWIIVPGSEVAGNNGLVASPDGKWLYVAGYANLTVNKISRGRVPYIKQAVKVGLLTDNLRWTPDGKLLAAGHAAPLADVLTGCNGTDHVVCPLTTGVAVVDPETMKARTLLMEPYSRNFGAGTTALVVGDELWIGSVRAQRIATLKLKDLQH